MRLLPFVLVTVMAVPASPARSLGGDATVVASRATEGALWWRTAPDEPPSPAPLLATDVDMKVTGVVLRAVVRQEFVNPGATWVEGRYVFPLPDDGAVDHLRMRVGDRVIEGVVQERAGAKTTYQRAKQQGRRVSLVEQERPNVFTASVANVPPGASVAIEIEYQQVLRLDDGQVRLRFPMVVAPRYIPGAPLTTQHGPDADGSGRAQDTDEVPDASRVTPAVRHPARGAIDPVSLRIELRPGAPLARLEAPHHRVATAPLEGGGVLVTLAEGAVSADRDFELVWELTPGTVPTVSVAAESTDRGVFALLMVVPPTAAEGPRTRREVVFVIDTSGSMHGASISQATAALKLALARLGSADTFNIIQFNSVTGSLFASARAATAANRFLADRYVSGLRAQGGTEMLPALSLALDAREHPGRLRQVIFLTDGAVGNEERLFVVIGERLGDSRLFTVGIGSAPNSHFMREAARIGRGAFRYVGSATEVQAKMEALFRKLESPVLTDVRLDLPGATPMEMYPATIPDLYLGEPILVALRADAMPARAVLRGRLGPARWEQEVWLQDADAGAGLGVHWARAKIAALLDRKWSGASPDDVRTAVVEVALAHHLVSPYTSLVAVDVTPARPGDAALHGHALETNLPHGWDETAVVGLGQGATPAPLHVVLGVAALVLAASLFLVSRRHPARLATYR